MSGSYTFPNANINLQDDSTVTVPDPTVLPLHLPLFGVFAETGPVGIPVLGGANALQNIFGTLFLNEKSPYFNHPNVFVKRALQYQQIYLVRLADPAATSASLVLLCTVTPTTLVQYQRASDGSVIKDVSGNNLPQLMVDGTTPVTQPGVTLTYSVRPLESNEKLSTVTTTTVTSGGVSSVTYPVIAFSTYVGNAGNRSGFRLFYDTTLNTNIVNNIGALTYSFQPVTLTPTTNIEAPVYDIYNSQTQTFSFLPGALDPTTDTFYNLQDVITNNFYNLPGLPYNFHVYNENVGMIGQAILTLSPELGSISPYMVNILSGVDQNGNTYEHMAIDSSTTTILNPNVVNYLQGGTDGSLSKTTLENQTAALLSGELNPLIADSFRFPFTHIYDSGYALTIKQLLTSIFSFRDDVQVTLSTQDVANPPNTAAQDQSTGSALRTAALLNVESTDFGTQCCRVSIYQQCGLLSDTQLYTSIVPATIDRMIKRCVYNNADYVKGEPKGRPNSEVTILTLGSLNWTPATPQQMQLSWNTGLNYIQYCDVATVFYPSLQSVYPLDNSLLASDVFTDYVAVYLKHLIRQQWTIIVGRDDPPKTLYQIIAKGIDDRASYVFGKFIKTSTVVSQTAVDSAKGYQLTVTTTVQGNMPNLVWKVIVPITRAS